MIKVKGSNNFRLRIILSLLSGKPVLIQAIRSAEENPGLTEYEVKFLRLMELLSNGTSVEINYTGTEVLFRPGSLYGGEINFDCGLDRSLVYYLEALLVLAPFSKFAFRVSLHGITADSLDQSVDAVKNVCLRILKHFGVDDGIDFKIKSRGAAPLGGGEVFFTCPIVQTLCPINFTDLGQIKKIRGVASTTRVSPQVSNRMIEAGRSLLNQFIPDVYIYSDVFKGEEAGRSSGYSLFLQAESTTGAILSYDSVGIAGEAVEEMAIRTAKGLLKEIDRSGMIGRNHQWMVLLLMALCPEDLSKVTFGCLTGSSLTVMEELKAFFGVNFKIRSDFPSPHLTTISCIGSGYINLNKRTQ